MDILVNRPLYMSCQAGPGLEPGPSALKASDNNVNLVDFFRVYLRYDRKVVNN